MLLSYLMSLDVTTILVSVIFFLLVRLCINRHGSHLPPCPVTPLPVVGHMFALAENPRPQMKAWRKKYGEIFSLYLGGSLVVVLNGYKIMKETLVDRAYCFSDRPAFFFDMLTGTTNKGIISSSGSNWKEQRATTVSILRTFGMGTNILAEKIQMEVSRYLEVLENLQGKATDIRLYTHVSVSNVICSIVIENRFDYEDDTFKSLLRMVSYNISQAKSTGILNFLPVLRYLPGDLFHAKRIKANLEKLMNLFAKKYLKLKGEVEYDEANTDNFIAAYLKERNAKIRNGTHTFLDESNLLKIIIDMFSAGTETTTTTITWCFLYVLHNPYVQRKIFHEIEREVGLARTPCMQDKERLIYLQAVIMETLRLSSISPLSVLKVCTKDVVIRGYTIPKGTNITQNIDSVLFDKTLWGEDADKFRPERFLNEDGHLIHKEEFIPFSMGRRICPGEALARMELFLFLSAAFQRFEFLPEDLHSLPTLKEIFGMAAIPTPYKIRVIPRQS